MGEPKMAPIDFSRLENFSKKINANLDELTTALTTINDKLNSLNLGFEVWVDDSRRWALKIESSEGNVEGYHTETRWFLGYGKPSQGKWGLLVRAEDWSVPNDSGDETYSEVNTSPISLLSSSRDLRIAAIEDIPELIKRLEKKGEEFTKAVSEAKELADEL